MNARHQRWRPSLLLSIALLCVSVQAAVSQQAFCRLELGPPRQQDTSSWCWAANLMYIENYFGCGETQCDFVNCFRQYAGLSQFCCSTANCDAWAPTVNNLAVGMKNFGFVMTANGSVRSPPAAVDLRPLLCDLGVVILGFFGNPPFNVTDGHAATIESMDVAQLPVDQSTLVKVMESGIGSHFAVVYSFLLNGNATNLLAGRWLSYVGVTGVNCPFVGIGDISGFWIETSGSSDVVLGFRIASTADPVDSAGVYVSDNPLGPARLIRGLVDVPVIDDPPGTQVNIWVDDWRPSGFIDNFSNYYYFLNHGPGPLPETMLPVDLFWNEDSPLAFGVDPRPVVDPPSNLTVADQSLDFGGTVIVQWDLSADDANLDFYHIYRQVVTGGFEYVTSVSPGTSLFTDNAVAPGLFYSYKVSAAHHGTVSLQSGDGNLGIWNDFSGASLSVAPVNNFASMAVTLTSNDTLLLSPIGYISTAGISDTLRVTLTIQGSDGSPTANVPVEDMILIAEHEDLFFCDGDTLSPVGPTDVLGQTEFVYSHVGGCDTLLLAAEVKGIPVGDTLEVFVQSPDLVADGIYNLQDLSQFAMAFGTGDTTCQDQNYTICVDYNRDCLINLVDLTIFATYQGGSCP